MPACIRVVQSAFPVLDEGLLYDVAQQTRFACHQLSQLGGRSNALRTGVFDMLHKRDETVCVRKADFVTLYLRQTHRLLPLAVFIQMEIQVVRKDNCVQRSFVTIKLLFVLLATVQIAVFKVFGFDIGDGQLFAQ